MIIHGKAGIWEVTKETKNEFKFSAGDQSVTILKIVSKKYQMAVVHIECAQSSNVKIWINDQDNDKIINEHLLPKISVRDFYSEKEGKNIPINYKGSISLYLYEGRIKASLYTWMETALENLDVKYEIYIDWNDDKFEIV